MKTDAVEQAVRALGTAIQADARYQAYTQAKRKSDEDTALQVLIETFETVRLQYQQETKKLSFQQNPEKLLQLEQAAAAEYAAIRENPHMIALESAQQAWDTMIRMVYDILSQCIAGEDPASCIAERNENCGGSCADCGGCGTRV